MPQIFLSTRSMQDPMLTPRFRSLRCGGRGGPGNYPAGGRLPRQKPPLTQARRSILAVSGGTTRRANAAELIRNI
jgi:hypothetical protein